jgi:hypothetical protein
MAQGRKILRRCYNCSRFKTQVLTVRNIEQSLFFSVHEKLIQKVQQRQQVSVWFCKAGCLRREYYISGAAELRNLRCKAADYFERSD